jgi:8-amino-7-oxononanoate synthase
VNDQARVSWDQLVADQLDEVRAAGRWRAPRDLATSGAVTGALSGTGREPAEVVSFASNDYLGLTHHPAVRAAACEAIERWGTGTGASRLVVGSRPLHAELEAELAAWKGTEDAVLFPTGYHANLGLLTTLAGAGVTVLSDELNHASIVDGCRLARARVQVVPHRDLDRVDAALATTEGPALVATDSAFSMDGDAADVEGLLTVCSWYGALLVIDEAHAVLGPDVPAWATRPAAGPGGAGGPLDPPLLRMGTLSKSLGSLGGYVAGPKPYIDLLRNRARSFIFTTASTPADTAAGLAAVRLVRSADGAALIARLRHLVDRVAPGHPTPIVPIVLGDEDTAIEASAHLLERGLLVPAIRPPTVAAGTSRLRVALSAAHTDDQVTHLLRALADLDLYRPAPVAVPRPLSLAPPLALPHHPEVASPATAEGESAAGDEATAATPGDGATGGGPGGGAPGAPDEAEAGDDAEDAAAGGAGHAVVIGLPGAVVSSTHIGATGTRGGLAQAERPGAGAGRRQDGDGPRGGQT